MEEIPIKIFQKAPLVYRYQSMMIKKISTHAQHPKENLSKQTLQPAFGSIAAFLTLGYRHLGGGILRIRLLDSQTCHLIHYLIWQFSSFFFTLSVDSNTYTAGIETVCVFWLWFALLNNEAVEIRLLCDGEKGMKLK